MNHMRTGNVKMMGLIVVFPDITWYCWYSQKLYQFLNKERSIFLLWMLTPVIVSGWNNYFFYWVTITNNVFITSQFALLVNGNSANVAHDIVCPLLKSKLPLPSLPLLCCFCGLTSVVPGSWGGAGAYPSGHRAKGGAHPGQVASPSQGHTETNETNDHTHTHTHS